HPLAAPHANRRKRLLPLLNLLPHRETEVRIRAAEIPLAPGVAIEMNDGERCRVLHRQRAQPYRIDQLEDGRVRADAQRQRQHRHRRKAGRLRQHPHAITQVLDQCAHLILLLIRSLRNWGAERSLAKALRPKCCMRSVAGMLHRVTDSVSMRFARVAPPGLYSFLEGGPPLGCFYVIVTANTISGRWLAAWRTGPCPSI